MAKYYFVKYETDNGSIELIYKLGWFYNLITRMEDTKKRHNIVSIKSVYKI